MSDLPAFFDTNVLLYLLSADERKADRAEALLSAGGWVSVQVLNETAAVCRRKLRLAWPRTEELLAAIRAHCSVVALTVAIHEDALVLAKRYGFSLYDALICSAANAAGARTLYTEDLQHGQVLGTLVVADPFR